MSDIAPIGDSREAVPTASAAPAPEAHTGHVDWQAVEQDPEFRTLVREKRNFILPATIIFFIYYFGFLILVGYFPSVVETNVIGKINVAYLFALSQFFMAWIIMGLYVWRAGTFDRLAQHLVTKIRGGTR